MATHAAAPAVADDTTHNFFLQEQARTQTAAKPAAPRARASRPATRSTARGNASASHPNAGLRALVARHAAEQGVPLDLAHGVVMVESRYNPKATGPGGYIGLMQLSHRTARGMGYTGSREALYHPDTNLRYGMKYLAGALRLAKGDYCGAVSRYQGGHGVRGVTRAGAVYCSKVKRHIAQMPREQKPQQTTTVATAAQ